MPDVYRFTAFPRSLGVILGKDEELHVAVTDVLEEWARDCITVHNAQAFLDQGTLTKVGHCPDTDIGWGDAFALLDKLETY